MKNILINPNQDEQTKRLFDYIKKSLEAAHQTNKALAKTANIRQALNSDDCDFCLLVAQDGLKKYRSIINSFAIFTNIIIVDISENEARNKGISHWKSVLKFEEMLVLADIAKDIVSKTEFENMIKEIYKKQM